MEFAKDEVFSIDYKAEKKESKILKFVTNHKFICSLAIIGLAVCSINCILIYNFFYLLSTL